MGPGRSLLLVSGRQRLAILAAPATARVSMQPGRGTGRVEEVIALQPAQDVRAWLEEGPSLSELSNAYPAEWETVKTELAALEDRGEHAWRVKARRTTIRRCRQARRARPWQSERNA